MPDVGEIPTAAAAAQAAAQATANSPVVHDISDTPRSDQMTERAPALAMATEVTQHVDGAFLAAHEGVTVMGPVRGRAHVLRSSQRSCLATPPSIVIHRWKSMIRSLWLTKLAQAKEEFASKKPPAMQPKQTPASSSHEEVLELEDTEEDLSWLDEWQDCGDTDYQIEELLYEVLE